MNVLRNKLSSSQQEFEAETQYRETIIHDLRAEITKLNTHIRENHSYPKGNIFFYTYKQNFSTYI